jgi:hypothetical protein
VFYAFDHVTFMYLSPILFSYGAQVVQGIPGPHKSVTPLVLLLLKLEHDIINISIAYV